MQGFTCDLCGAHPFTFRAALRTHQRTCIGTKRQREEEHSAYLRTAGIPEATEGFDGVTDHGARGFSEPFLSCVDEPIDDVLDFEDEQFLQNDRTRYVYDSTFSLVHWARTIQRGEGLSNSAINRLFKEVLLHPNFKIENLSISSAYDIEKYERSLYNEGDGWRVENIGGHVLRYRDPLIALESLFSSPVVASNFTMVPAPEVVDAQVKEYSTPATGSWWRSMQEHVIQEHGSGIVAPLIFHSDKTCLSSDRKISGHPLYMSIANISCEDRYLSEGHCLLAIFPNFSVREQSSLQRLKAFHSCLSHIFKALKDMSHEGITLIDPFGYEQRVFPRLYAYVCDHEESCKVTCTYDTNRCQHPCSVCMCQANALVHVGEAHTVYRSEPSMKAVYEEMAAAPPRVRDRISKEHSLHAVQCALWGFAGGDTEFGNPYLAINVDMLHQADLGVFKTLMDIVQDISKELDVNPIPELDRRLSIIKDSSRFFQFRVPGSDRGGYFTSNANFAAFEHRAIMQVIVFCLLGLLPNFFIEAVVNFLQWYELACRTKDFDEQKLTAMDNCMKRTVNSFRIHLSSWQKSGFNIVKVHNMKHYAPSIRRSGVPMEYNSNMYEHLHMAMMKTGYRMSNKRNFLDHIVKCNRRLEALRANASDIDGYACLSRKNPALEKTLEAGFHILAGFQVHLNMRVVHLYAGEGNLASNCNLRQPASKRQRILHSILQVDVLTHLRMSLGAYMIRNNLTGGEILQIYRSVAVCPSQSLRCEKTPMFARATPCFHGKEWFSSVSIKREVGNEAERTSYGQLRLLFKCNMLEDGHTKVSKELCFIRMYEEVEFDSRVQCPALKWQEDNAQSYEVVDISNILKSIHVVPDFENDRRFYINVYKF